jgi:hypothetical protein
MNAILLNARHMVYRRLSHISDDRPEGRGFGPDLARIVRGELSSPIKDLGSTLARRFFLASGPPLAVELLACPRRARLVPWRCRD